MYKKDAQARGLLAPKKERCPTGDKARRPENDKVQRPDADKVSECVPVEPSPEADDFTVISGVGSATAEMLHERGLHTFDDLQAVETEDLPERVGQAIERWRDGE
jgi:predicted flap endonuclease-1-like 5' DNA nuclease